MLCNIYNRSHLHIGTQRMNKIETICRFWFTQFSLVWFIFDEKKNWSKYQWTIRMSCMYDRNTFWADFCIKFFSKIKFNYNNAANAIRMFKNWRIFFCTKLVSIWLLFTWKNHYLKNEKKPLRSFNETMNCLLWFWYENTIVGHFVFFFLV